MAITTKPSQMQMNIEAIVDSPEVRGLLDKLAGKKLELGTNPLKTALREQLSHLRYHILGPVIASERSNHPEIKYDTLGAVLKDSGAYLSKAGFHLLCHMKSLLLLRKNVGYDARRMVWEDKALGFAGSVASTREPKFVSRSNEQAARFLGNSFSRIIVTGLEDTLADGRTVADYLREGHVIVFRNHQSYASFVVDKDVYAKHGIGNITFIAGSNIVDMKDRSASVKWREQLTRSGVKMVDRSPPKGKDGLLYFTVLGTSLALDLSGGSNETIYGDGREKGRTESSLKTALISFFLKHGKFILSVAESYEKILDDRELAYAAFSRAGKGGGASFDTLLALEGTGNNPCGEIYLNFGKPIPTSEYGHDNRSMRSCEVDARERATQLVTLSSTYLLAAAVKNSGLADFSVGRAAYMVGDLLGKIRERNAGYAKDNVVTRVFIAPKLAEGSSLSDVVHDAAEKLASRGALISSNTRAYSVLDPVMLEFYAAKGEAALSAHGISVAKKA